MSDVEQLSTKGLSSSEIAKAYREGRLDEYLRRSNRPASPADPGSGGADQGAREAGLRISREGLRRLSSRDIETLRKGGLLDEYMRESNTSLAARGRR